MDFITRSPLVIALTVVLAVVAGICPLEAATPLRGLIFNEDCTNFFYYQTIPPGKAGETIDRYVDVYAAAGVKTLLCNTNAQRTNYRSRVWDAFWDGYDPAGPDDQPFLAPLPRDYVAKYRHMVGNMREVDRQGIDYPARFIARCRHNGISPWITLRMNDCHNQDNAEHPIHGTFWKNNPQLRVRGIPAYYSRCFDYAHREVRDYYKSLIVETLDRWDIDGLELDFMREPYLFSAGKQSEGGKLLTEWLGDIRKLVDAAAQRRGHPMRLGVRVPSRPETAKAFGLDAVAWAKAGLVDLVVPTPRWATIEFDMPMERWHELLAETNVTLAGGLEVLYRPHPALRPRCVTLEQAAGAAAVVLSRGADAVYLFNYFQDGHPDWSRPDYLSTLRAMNSLETLSKLPRCVALTYREIRAAGEKDQNPLPATGEKLSFSLPRGPMPGDGAACTLTLAIAVAKEQPQTAPVVRVNDKPCAPRGEQIRDGFCELTYDLAREALAADAVLRISVLGSGTKVTVHRLEVAFR
jgi:hypothetical protein